MLISWFDMFTKIVNIALDLSIWLGAAKKAADRAAALDGAASEENRCIDALSQLKHFPITYQLLVSTQVGKQLRCLTNHPRKKIQSFARDVLRIWKNAVIKTNNGDVNNGKMGNKNSVKMEPVTAKSAYVDKVQKTPNNGTPSPDSYNKQTSSDIKFPPKPNSMVKCNDELRDKVREQIYDSLCKVLTEAGDDIKDEVNACDPERVAVSVECAMFESWGKSNGDKRIRYRSTLFNIKDQNNPDFRRKILLGEIKPHKIVNMTTEEMASDRRKLENKQLKEKALFNCQRPDAPTATTDQFKCGRCGSRKTTYNQIQTRSADEPMTTYVTCTNCKNCWKFC
ncbi:Zinc finger, TFIIS-type [Corchorus olitorius]|uniref:Transcription elongation factor n=1 Tax=Corchorus olitorius TaxID=93759 RepID=A0A1R3J561_9ROSI|nr:Zinc finger, TFIIS-type [Corchorus olitorius]